MRTRTSSPAMPSPTISLKPVGGIPGDATRRPDPPDGRSRRATTASTNCASPTPRTSCCRTSRKADLYALWQQLDAAGLGTANLDLIGDIIACPGLDYCSLANARSIPVAQKISERFAAGTAGAIWAS